jgi:hypothetical protein
LERTIIFYLAARIRRSARESHRPDGACCVTRPHEAPLFTNNAFLVAASVFPYFYALVGERNRSALKRDHQRRIFTTGVRRSK